MRVVFMISIVGTVIANDRVKQLRVRPPEVIHVVLTAFMISIVCIASGYKPTQALSHSHLHTKTKLTLKRPKPSTLNPKP